MYWRRCETDTPDAWDRMTKWRAVCIQTPPKAWMRYDMQTTMDVLFEGLHVLIVGSSALSSQVL